MSRSAWWFKFDISDRRRAAKPPHDVARVILAGDLNFLPSLVRIIRSPILAPSGRIVEQAGYDGETQAYYVPGDLKLPTISERPTQADIHLARNLLLHELLVDFPFSEQADRANALGMFLLPFVRDCIAGPTPLHLLEKPTPGSGATLLVEVLGQIVRGEPPTMMTEGSDEAEWRKRITSTLLTGPDIVAIDNLRQRLDSAALSSVLTGRVWTDRRLGVSENVNPPIRCVWIATGNNPAVSNEIARRVVSIRIDPKMERPWERKDFRHPKLVEWAQEHRSNLISAALALARAWVSAGRPEGTESIGSYERWAAVVGGILNVAGVEGFLKNRDRFYDVADRESAAWGAFVSGWWETYKDHRVGVKELWDVVESSGTPVDLGQGSERSQRIRFGEALLKTVGRHFAVDGGAVNVEMAGKVSGAAQYRLVPDKASPSTPPGGESGESRESFLPPYGTHIREYPRKKDSQHSRDSLQRVPS